MSSLLLIGWLALPLAPLNPLEQDTVRNVNLHFSIGLNSPNSIVSAGPNLSIKYELLAVHPVILRAALDYAYSRIDSRLYPNGNLHTATASLEVLYYRGTHHLMGYLGGGAVLANHWFLPTSAASDSLFANEQVTDVDLARQFGYRLTLGLRYRQSYSFEITMTELRPDLVKWGLTGRNLITREGRPIKTGGFRLSFGYLVPLSSF